ncbi:MAG: GFA family protein [Myxococcota bacterium]|nr:GFA family protein [Myxococcota bacterium]
MKPIPLPCEGGCVCGRVRYRLLEDPLELHVCHCTDCQSITGSAFVMTASVRRQSLELLCGEPERLAYETTEGIARCDLRCRNCGTRVWSEPARFPEILSLRPGTLDDTSWLEPIAHIWTASAQPWVPIPEGVRRHERNPDDVFELVRAWREREGAPGRGAAAGKG